MTAKTIRQCPVCDSIDNQLVYEQKFSKLAGMDEDEFIQKVACCKSCGMVFVREYLSDEMLSKYYSTMSTYEYAEANFTYPEAHAKRSRQQFRFISQFNQAFLDVLDVGCSLGYTLSLFKETGSNVLGIEPSAKLKGIAKETYGVDVFTGFIDRDFDIGERFDLVILSHVAEHLNFPLDVLVGMANALNEDGLVYVEVPSIELFDDRDLFQFSFEHINYFSYGSLSNLMHRAGFEAVDHIVFENDNGTAPFYPTLGTLWRKASRTYPMINRYPHDHKVVERYVNLVIRYTGQLNERIADIVDKYNSIAIWGAGTLTAQLLAQTPLRTSNIQVIYDNDPKKHGLTMSGIPIRKPNATKDFMDEDEVDTIIIGSWSSQDEIFEQLVSIGIPPEKLQRLFLH